MTPSDPPDYDPRLALLHADMDAFYASVEVLDDPSLRGRPLIVGHDGKRGVVSTASYEARKFGVHSAMPSVVARRLCPDAVWRAPRMTRYAELSRQIRAIFLRFTPLIEPLSLDEAFLDVAGSLRLFGGAVRIAEGIRAQVRAETGGLTVSIGVAENMFLAKIASDARKPDGLTVIPAGGGAEYLAPLPVERLWGVGKKTAERLHGFGLRTISDMAKLPETTLVQLLGEGHGMHLARLARGLDDRSVQSEHVAKSISSERTFEEDLHDDEPIEHFLFQAADEVATQLRATHLAGRTVELKVRTGSFRTWTRSKTLDAPTQLAGDIHRIALELLRTRVDLEGEGVRLLGAGVSGLVDADRPAQATLFERCNALAESRAAELLDLIRSAHGDAAVKRARLLEPPGGDDRRLADPARAGEIRRRELHG